MGCSAIPRGGEMCTRCYLKQGRLPTIQDLIGVVGTGQAHGRKGIDGPPEIRRHLPLAVQIPLAPVVRGHGVLKMLPHHLQKLLEADGHPALDNGVERRLDGPHGRLHGAQDPVGQRHGVDGRELVRVARAVVAPDVAAFLQRRLEQLLELHHHVRRDALHGALPQRDEDFLPQHLVGDLPVDAGPHGIVVAGGARDGLGAGGLVVRRRRGGVVPTVAPHLAHEHEEGLALLPRHHVVPALVVLDPDFPQGGELRTVQRHHAEVVEQRAVDKITGFRSGVRFRFRRCPREAVRTFLGGTFHGA
mmetsp:Transcript_47659/g.93081  ORF Transcript_47659/g.93081 Transcript_47659/m.93081 type:complete len:303 (-) Transcript_47659:258-1166(-)